MQEQDSNLNRSDLEGKAIALASSLTKQPFKVAFLATLGVGLARLVLFLLAISALGGIGYLIFK